MARRGIGYIVERGLEITILLIGSVVLVALCMVSISQADNTLKSGDIKAPDAVSPAAMMQILMTPAGMPADSCLMPIDLPKPDRCKIFFKVDDEDVLENLIQNYTSCLDGHDYYYNFHNSPITITRTLKIYGRTGKAPLVIDGLNLTPAKNFPKGQPAIAVFGKSVKLKNASLKGFDNGIVFVTAKDSKHELIGGKIVGGNKSDRAIISCNAAPTIAGTEISGFKNEISVVGDASENGNL